MSIAFTKFIDIVSGVGGVGGVTRRELIGRLFTDNQLVPTGGVLEFTELADVLAYFGSTSEEYKRAAFYFGFISKLITSPQKISYAYWPETATVPLIFGGKTPKSLADFTPIANGEFDLTLAGITATVGPCDFTLSASLADVATVLQTQVQAANADPQFTGATVTYDATRGAFNLVAGGPAGDANVTTAVSGGGTDILTLIDWVDTGLVTGTGAIFSDGADAQTVTEFLTTSTEANNNFGSFLFIPALTTDEQEEASVWNAAQNVRFMYMLPSMIADAAAKFALLGDNGGTGVTISETADQYPEMIPMALLAATRYDRRNSTFNYMFTQADGIDASVTDTTTSNSLDAVRANYYGQTQQAGQLIEFYQRGDLMGSSEDPIAMNVYANEMWLKDAAGVALMNLLLALPKVSANKTGRAQVMGTVQSVIDQALFNGVISVGKPLNNTQKQFIEVVTGDPQAWYQVQNVGYWFDAVIQQDGSEWKAVYTLIYSKDDAIRKVDGTHILI